MPPILQLESSKYGICSILERLIRHLAVITLLLWLHGRRFAADAVHQSPVAKRWEFPQLYSLYRFWVRLMPLTQSKATGDMESPPVADATMVDALGPGAPEVR